MAAAHALPKAYCPVSQKEVSPPGGITWSPRVHKITFSCPACGGKINWHYHGEIIHATELEAACPCCGRATHRINLEEENVEYHCSHCRGGIKVQNRLPEKLENIRAASASGPLRLKTLFLSQGAPGHLGKGVLIVHGFLNNDQSPKDYGQWVASLRRIGWRGNIYGLQWDAGNLYRLCQELRALLIPIPGVWPAKVAAKATVLLVQSINHWMNACKCADNTGALLAISLGLKRPAWASDELHLVGFSLGCRLIYAVLGRAAKDGKVIADSLSLFGGAASVDWNWVPAATAVKGKLVNYYTEKDQILKFLYQAATLFRETPIGLAPIATSSNKIINVDLTHVVRGHLSYETDVRNAAFQNFSGSSPQESGQLQTT